MKPKEEYLVILERGEHNWGAYAPDVLGCISTGQSREQTRLNFVEALQGHLDWMRQDGDLIPLPSAETETISVTLSGHAPRPYLVILQPSPIGSWSVSAADVPDLTLEFSSRAEALHLFRAALQAYLETLSANGEPLPEPASEGVTVAVQLVDALAAA